MLLVLGWPAKEYFTCRYAVILCLHPKCLTFGWKGPSRQLIPVCPDKSVNPAPQGMCPPWIPDDKRTMIDIPFTPCSCWSCSVTLKITGRMVCKSFIPKTQLFISWILYRNDGKWIIKDVLIIWIRFNFKFILMRQIFFPGEACGVSCRTSSCTG